MALLTTIQNPFDPINSREVKEIESGKPIYSSITGFYCFYDVAVSVNGQITTDYEYIVKPEDHIGFVAIPEGGGGGKNPLATIAMIALVVTAPYMAGAVMGATAGMVGAGVYGGLTGAMIFGGLQVGMIMLGGMLINSLMPPSTPDAGNPSAGGLKSSQTYGWENSYNQSSEGITLPIVYGKSKIVPPIISQYVETKNNKQYLNVLYALNDGEIASVSDIMINGNPIGFYNEVTYATRLGTNNQTLIPAFDNTRVDTGVSAKVSTTATVRRTANNNVTGLNVIVSAPSGIYYANDTGGLDTRSVTLEVGYRKVGDANYTTVVTTFSGKSTSTLRTTVTFDALPAGQYDISVRRTTAESTTTRTQDKVYFEAFTEVIYDDFIYPNVALLAIKALATDQLNGSMPQVTCVVDRGNNTSNPAIASQNVLALLGADINTTAFNEWASWCTAQNLQCNIVFDSEVNVRDALNMLGTLGRGNIVQIGSEYVPIIDREEALPTQRFLFTMGNIIRDSFREDYLPLADRSNAVEITYYDSALGYDRQTIELYQHGFDESNDTLRKASIALYGCTNRTQAIRHGRYLLNKNRYITNTVSFEADVDAIACTIGDIIDVSHDLPQWGYSGRVEAIGIIDASHWAFTNVTLVNGVTATELNTTLIQLDREIEIGAGLDYAIAFRLSDDTRVTVTINSAIGLITDILPIPNTTLASQFDIYAFGSVGTTSKLFRVAGITRSSDQRRRISAIEYIPEVYNDLTDVLAIPTISGLKEVTYLMVTSDTEVTSDGRSINIVNLMWGGQAIAWDIYMENSLGTEWAKIGNTQLHYFQIKDVKAGYYNFKVGDKTASITITVAKVPLADVTNFVSYFQNNQLVLRWDAVVEQYRTPIMYEIRRGASWSNSEILGKVYNNSFIVDVPNTYWVKAYYKSLDGVEVWSTNATGALISNATISKNIVATWDESATGWSGTLSGSLTLSGGNLVLPNNASFGAYDIPLAHITTLSAPQLCRLSLSYSVAGGNVGLMWDDILDLDAYPNIDGDVTGAWTAKPKLAISQDGTTWGAWQDFVIGDYVGMAFKARLELYSTNNDITVVATGFVFAVDMPDRVDSGTGVAISASGSYLSYVNNFQTVPNVQITIANAQQGDYYSLTNESASGFSVQVLNGGTGVARNINWIAQGY